MKTNYRHEMTGGGSDFDRGLWEEIEKIIESDDIPIRDVLESFPIFTRRINITKMLIYHELFKQTYQLPGDIVECGVYRGNTLLMLAKFLEIYCPGDRIKKIIGFDNFKGFESFNEKDGKSSERRSKVIGGWNSSNFKNILTQMIDIHNRDSYLPRAPRIELIEGDICETAEQYVENNPGIRISFLHLNCNLYEPTLAALKAFYPKVVPGGIIVCAEYGMKEWMGESLAVEEYFNSNMPKLQRYYWHNQPNCFFVKE